VPSKVTETLWAMPPHTKAKLDILRFYLNAWLPIMSAWNRTLVYLDGFAGPGRYLGGEDGSPIVALKATLERQQPISASVAYLFVEGRQDRADHLRSEVAKLSRESRTTVRVECGRFADLALGLVDPAVRGNGRTNPLFAFIDPFGWDVPFDIVRQLLKYRNSEVFVNFMFDPVRRFLSAPQQAANWDGLFGTKSWRDIRDDPDPESRARRIPSLYKRQLIDAGGAEYVLSFEMRDIRNGTDYYLFFATKDRKGLEKMKDAMWRVDGNGGHQFRDPQYPDQPLLIEVGPDFTVLRKAVTAQFGGRAVYIEELEQFVLEQTAFRLSDLRTPVLAPMEAESPPALQVTQAKPGRKRGQFPPGTIVQFARSAQLTGGSARLTGEGRVVPFEGSLIPQVASPTEAEHKGAASSAHAGTSRQMVVTRRTKSGGVISLSEVPGWKAVVRDRGHRLGFTIRIYQDGIDDPQHVERTGPGVLWEAATRKAVDLIVTMADSLN
jgi:three-Cys-motif partner protein